MHRLPGLPEIHAMAIAYDVQWAGLAAALLEDLQNPNATVDALEKIVRSADAKAPTVVEGSGEFRGFSFVDLLDDPIAAGPPMEVDQSTRSARLAFSTLWLDRLRITEPVCMKVGSYERSMLGTINPGDIVLVDCSDKRRFYPVDDHVYAVHVPYRGATLKRVYKTARGFSLVSDNPDKDEYAAVPLLMEEDEVSSNAIVGEVMWKGQPPV